MFIGSPFSSAPISGTPPSQTPDVGPVSGGLDTVLTRPGGTFSKEKYRREIDRIREDTMAFLASIPSREGLSELEIAELDFADAEAAHQTASEKLSTSHSPQVFSDAQDAKRTLRDAQGRLDDLRAAKAKREAIDAAKAKIRAAINKRKVH